MPVLTLGYRCCDRKRPLYLKHSEVEGYAVLARQQLGYAGADAMPLSTLSDISGLKINGIEFALAISTEHQVHDESGKPVCGICEYDPGVPDTAMVLVSPAAEATSEALVLSTLAHELGHAVFDAPQWIVEASKGPGLFDAIDPGARRAYRTTTRDGEHLGKVTPVAKTAEKIAQDVYFSELRANEFMGSLLVPRQRLNLAVEELAPKFGVTIHRGPSLDPEMPGTAIHLTADGDIGFVDMECLQKALAKRFSVNRRFIQVRMERYGLLKQGAGMR